MATTTPQAPAPATQSLSRRFKLAYGAGDIGAAIVTAINGFFLNAFLLDVAGLHPGSVALIFLLTRIWDGFTDPAVGVMADRTQTRFGRKRPWLLFGAVPFGLAFVLHWAVPPLSSEGLFAYYLGVSLLLTTAFTAVNVPYTAMITDLTPDYDERTRLTFYRFSFSILGGMLAVVLHPLLVASVDDVYSGHLISAAVWGVMIVGSAWITFFSTGHVQEVEPQEQPGNLRERLGVVLSNRPFLYVTTIFLLSWSSLQFIQTNLLLYVRYWVGAEDQFSLIVFILQLTAFAFLGIWSKISERIGKKRVYAIGVTLWAGVLIALYFLPAGNATPLFIASFLAGIGVSVAYLIPWSMLPDVIEYSELTTGQRQESVYYGLFVFLQKIGLAIGIAFSNVMLGVAGYQSAGVVTDAVVQPESVLLTLRLFITLVPAGLLLLSLPVVARYPIDRTVYADIQSKLNVRRTTDDYSAD